MGIGDRKMKLVDCVTEHPGGWQDIIDAIGEKTASVGGAAYDVTFGVETRPDFRGRKTIHIERRYRGEFKRLEDIEGDISGRVAATGWEWLRINGYPLPGSEAWMKPAKEW